MNWRRGLLRLWVIGSLFWAGLTGWLIYDRIASGQERAASHAACMRNPPRESCGPLTFDDIFTTTGLVYEFAIRTLPPVFLSLVLGLAILWIVAGFTRHNL